MNTIDKENFKYSHNLTLRAQLEEDLAKYLANGGKINEMAMGETMASPFNYNGEKNIDTTKKNKQNLNQNHQTTSNQPKKETNEISFSKKVNITKKTEKKAKAEPKKTSNAKIVEMAFQKAILDKKTLFEAPCKTHGMTQYEIFNDNARCSACRIENYTKRINTLREQGEKTKLEADNAINEAIRRENIRNAKNEAIANGKKQFTAKCAHHGDTVFRIYENIGRCIECRRDTNKRNIYKQKVKSGTAIDLDESNFIEGKRIAEITRRKNEALKQGCREFEAECSHHGMTKYILIRNIARCEICQKQNTAKSNAKRYQPKDNVEAA